MWLGRILIPVASFRRRKYLERVPGKFSIPPEKATITRREEGSVVPLKQLGLGLREVMHGIDAIVGDLELFIELVDHEKCIPEIRAYQRIAFVSS